MTAHASGAIRLRKQPVQARSAATVDAIFEASLQVLRASGYRKLTTTRVAERAGVSVGTLYQYFPDRQALTQAVLERYLGELATAIEADCRPLLGRPLKAIAIGMVDAFVEAKWRRVAVSRVMHELLVEVGGLEIVRGAAARSAGFIADLLRSCPDLVRQNVEPLAAFLVMSCSAMLQAAFMDHVVDRETIRTHMRAMVRGYLLGMNAEAAPWRPSPHRTLQTRHSPRSRQVVFSRVTIAP